MATFPRFLRAPVRGVMRAARPQVPTMNRNVARVPSTLPQVNQAPPLQDDGQRALAAYKTMQATPAAGDAGIFGLPLANPVFQPAPVDALSPMLFPQVDQRTALQSPDQGAAAAYNAMMSASLAPASTGLMGSLGLPQVSQATGMQNLDQGAAAAYNAMMSASFAPAPTGIMGALSPPTQASEALSTLGPQVGSQTRSNFDQLASAAYAAMPQPSEQTSMAIGQAQPAAQTPGIAGGIFNLPLTSSMFQSSTQAGTPQASLAPTFQSALAPQSQQMNSVPTGGLF